MNRNKRGKVGNLLKKNGQGVGYSGPKFNNEPISEIAAVIRIRNKCYKNLLSLTHTLNSLRYY